MSLKPENPRTSSPAPWSTKSPWDSQDPPGAFPHSPSSQGPLADVSTYHSVSAAVKARKDEYVRKRSMKIKVGTWNVASISGTEKDLGGWFVDGFGVKGLSQDLAGLTVESSQDLTKDEHVESVQDQEGRLAKKKTTLPKHDIAAVPHGDDIGLYVLGLQEVIDVASVTEAMKPFTDPNPGKKWKSAMRNSLPKGYEKVAEQQLLGLLILIFASPEVAPTISSVSCTSVGTGLMGYLGNKGAVSVRLVLAETTKLCFVNCHLAAGADQTSLNRRIWDTNQIVSRTRFAPVSIDGEVVEVGEEKIGDEDIAFWFGDLNYRLDDIPGEDVRRLLLLHTRNEYDIVNKSKRRIDSELGYINPPPSTEHLPLARYETGEAERPASDSAAEPPLDPKTDPASLHTTLQSLLAHDQLKAQQRSGKVFHDGWREADINFLPTYKYDVGSVGMFDSGEKKRSPSWCDRILFRTRQDRLKYTAQAKKQAEARKRDEDMKKRGLDQEAAEQDVLFDYDPEVDGLAYGEDYDEEEEAQHDAELVQTKEGYEDELEVLHYISHQRVLSSDHKPLNAIFSLTYDAAIPELKAQVQQEVARELDKAENEGRPAVTVVLDNHTSDSESETDDSTEQSDVNYVNFGRVRLQIPKSRYMTIANTGQTPASFSFVGRGVGEGTESSIAPPWLKIRTSAENEEGVSEAKSKQSLAKESTLPPGESMTIELTIDISGEGLAYQLNQNKSQLDDVLVLRVTNGRDHFIPVKGTWMQTCFYRTLDELVTAPEGGVRNLPRSAKNRDSTGANDVKSKQTHHSAPKELYVLTESVPSLVERSVADWDMMHPDEAPPWSRDGSSDLAWPFDPKTWTFESGRERSKMLANVRESLDTAKSLEDGFDPSTPSLVRLEILCETLRSFLRSLRDGIITTTTWATIEQKLSALEKDKSHQTQNPAERIQALIMDALSTAPVHSVSMTFLTFTLSRVVNEIAPIGKEQLKSLSPQIPLRSRASSTLSSDTEIETASELSSTIPSSHYHNTAPPVTTATASSPPSSSTRRSFLPSIPLRRRRGTSSATAEDDAATAAAAALDRRRALVSRYVAIFAPLVIRSDGDGNSDRVQAVKGREKRALEKRKMTVLEAFLEGEGLLL